MIHSVWWRAVARIPEKIRRQKHIVTCFADDPRIVFREPEVLKVMPYISAWICEYRESLDLVNSWGLPAFQIPSVVDLSVFRPSDDKTRLQKNFKEKYGIADNAYLIGNFHRDSDGNDLTMPKRQKGADVFLEIVSHLKHKALPIHVVIAGPRRHWLRKNLHERNIPFTYVGEVIKDDDRDINTFTHDKIRDLNYVLDLYLITSRWEGAPNSVLEAAATKTKVISTRVGQAPDILMTHQIYDEIHRAVELIEFDIKQGLLNGTVESCFDHILKNNTYDKVKVLLRQLHKMVLEMPVNPSLYQKRTWFNSSRTVVRYPSSYDFIADRKESSLVHGRYLFLPNSSDFGSDHKRRLEQQAKLNLANWVYIFDESDKTLSEQNRKDLLEKFNVSIKSWGEFDATYTNDVKPLALWINRSTEACSTAVKEALRSGIPVCSSYESSARELAHTAWIQAGSYSEFVEKIPVLLEYADSLNRICWPMDNSVIRAYEKDFQKEGYSWGE